MFDIGWSELLVIGIVALIVIGPKDLPEMFRTLGRFTAKARGMAREFQRAMETAADETGVKDVAADLRKVTSPKAMGLDAVKGAVDKFEAWDPMSKSKAAKSAAGAMVASSIADEADADEVDLADAPILEKPVREMGPATKALSEAQAEKKAALAAKTAARMAASADARPRAKPVVKPEPAAEKPVKAPRKTAKKLTTSGDL